MATTLTRNKRLAASKRLRAADLMTSNPTAIRHTACARQVAELLGACRIHTAPVVDEAGRLIGVVNSSDLFDLAGNAHRHADTANRDLVVNSTNAGIYPEHDRCRNNLTVLQIMNPAVFSVRADASIAKVINRFVKRRIRRLFVTDRNAVLVGEICIFELLRTLGEYVEPMPRARHRP